MLSIEKALQSPLLSPPTSPLMSSNYAADSASADWQSRQTQQQSSSSFVSFPSSISDILSREYSHPSSERPQLLRSHKSVPNFLEPAFTVSRSHSALGTVTAETSPQDDKDKRESSPVSRSEPALSIQTGTVPTSPETHLTTPVSPVNRNESSFEDDSVLMDVEDDDDLIEKGDDRTAAERRADKRKMKRFRLTHQQTRFLMSEFSRQAHPDAAHRERLAREIPGLTPRQVQVWFQNRRAKMKRLTADDQERMLRSRALPEDFDMSQALQSSYSGSSLMGTPLASPVSYTSPYADAPFVRPLILDNTRRPHEGDATTSPIAVHSAYPNNYYTPPDSDNVSPVSTTSERHFSALSGHQATSRSGNIFLRSSSFSSAYQQAHHHQIPRLQLQDRTGRSRAESLQSPLRSSLTYSSNSLDYDENRRPAAEQPPSMRNEASGNCYGLGHQNPHLQGFQSAALSRVRPMGTSIPPGLQLRSEYRPSSTSQPPQTSSFPMQGAPLNTPPEYQFPQLSAPYHSTSFGPTAYRQQTQNATPMSFPSSAGMFSSPNEQPHTQRTPNDNTSRSSNSPSSLPTRNTFEIPRRSFTYDYGTHRS